jgi:hypothetical protein
LLLWLDAVSALGEEECEWACWEEVAAFCDGVQGFVHGPPGEFEVLFGGRELLGAEGEVAGLVEVDASGGGEGEGVGAEGAPGGGGDAGFFVEFATGAFLVCFAGFFAAAGEEEVVASVVGEMGAEEGHEAVVVAGDDYRRVTGGASVRWGCAHTGRG